MWVHCKGISRILLFKMHCEEFFFRCVIRTRFLFRYLNWNSLNAHMEATVGAWKAIYFSTCMACYLLEAQRRSSPLRGGRGAHFPQKPIAFLLVEFFTWPAQTPSFSWSFFFVFFLFRLFFSDLFRIPRTFRQVSFWRFVLFFPPPPPFPSTSPSSAVVFLPFRQTSFVPSAPSVSRAVQKFREVKRRFPTSLLCAGCLGTNKRKVSTMVFWYSFVRRTPSYSLHWLSAHVIAQFPHNITHSLVCSYSMTLTCYPTWSTWSR